MSANPTPEAAQKPNFRALAKDLNANVLKCIEGVLEKHSAAILSELYDDVQRQKALAAAQQPEIEALVFVDSLGAGRKSPDGCHGGVAYIQHANRVYWPLSAEDQERLRKAECGRGEFNGPSNHAAVDGAIDKARFKKAPCYLCGYNGPGYYQPDTHPCAAKYHAALEQEEDHEQ